MAFPVYTWQAKREGWVLLCPLHATARVLERSRGFLLYAATSRFL
jgi:hypothetical protein